jgi:hypothetical protein
MSKLSAIPSDGMHGSGQGDYSSGVDPYFGLFARIPSIISWSLVLARNKIIRSRAADTTIMTTV